MRRRSGASSKPAKTRYRKTAARKRRNTPKPVSRRISSAASLHNQVALLTRERDEALEQLSEALEQQNATADVLSVISTSPGALEPVFQAMLENAARVCDAKFGMLFRLDENGAIRPVASLGVPEQLMEYFQHGSRQPSENAPIMRASPKRSAGSCSI